MNYRTLTAPCGIDCFNCEAFETNITKELQQRVAQHRNIDPESVRCQGCRISGCFLMPGECAAKSCVEDKGVEFCYECDEFPCSKLQPCLDGAATYPQNYKLFNLCRMQKIGVERWAREEAGTIRRLYKEGVYHIGQGPKLTLKKPM